MRAVRLLPLLAVAAALAGCGGGSTAGGGAAGTAALWITRDRGATVVAVESVEAGQTAMQALRGAVRVDTRYGGRYVQAIGGVAGSLSQRRDWFFYVNGIAADIGAADYRLHPGDVEWWDYRSWRGDDEWPVVVGAFPEPFLHGYGGKVRSAAVRYRGAALAAGARAIGLLLHARSVAPEGTPVDPQANLFLLLPGPSRFTARLRQAGESAGSPVEFAFAGDAVRLARDPASYRFRFEVAG